MVPKELQDARETYQGAVAAAEKLLRAPRGDGPAVSGVEALAETLLAALRVNDALMVPLLTTMAGSSSAAAEAIGPGILALRLGLELGRPARDLERLGLATLLHEIGRARHGRGEVPAALRRSLEEQVQPLRQRGPFHVEVADLVLRAHDGLSASAAAPAADGDLGAVVRMAVTAHGLASQGSAEGRAWPPRSLKEILRRERARFPDAILKALIGVLTMLPLGSLVCLNSGEIGYVVAKNEGLPLRPVVAVWISQGRLLAEAKPVDLQDNAFLFVEEFLGEGRLEHFTKDAAR
jgi:hypothetical protein